MREDQQPLFLLTIILNDDRSMVSYNIDNYSIIVVGEFPRGGTRTRRTAVLRVNEFPKFIYILLIKVKKMMKMIKGMVNVLFVMKLVHMVLIMRMISVNIGECFICND